MQTSSNRTTCTLQGILPRLFVNCAIFEQGHNSCCRLIGKKQELALKHWDTVLLFPFSESAPQTASLNIEVIDEEAIPGQLSPHQVITVAGPYPNTSTIFVKNWSPAKKLTFNISCVTEKTVYPAPQVLFASCIYCGEVKFNVPLLIKYSLTCTLFYMIHSQHSLLCDNQ